ncbi:hypothetical protein JXI42_07925 [bacterium]|nr:hypothetical protein [bacterium]
MKSLIVCFVLISILFFSTSAYAEIKLTVSGNVNLALDKKDIAKNTTNVFEVTHPAIIDAVALNVSDSHQDSKWTVKVKLADSDWASDFEVFIKRTSDGNGAGSIEGEREYQLITDSYEELFQGEGDRSNVTVQFKLAGASENLPAGQYSLPFKFEIVQETSNMGYQNNASINTYSYNNKLVSGTR